MEGKPIAPIPSKFEMRTAILVDGGGYGADRNRYGKLFKKV